MKQNTTRLQEHSGDRLFFEGGAGRFFYKGTNGRWRNVLTDEDLALYETAAAQLDPRAALMARSRFSADA